jgi:hypothetical protein
MAWCCAAAVYSTRNCRATLIWSARWNWCISDYEFGPFSDSDIGLAASAGLRFELQDNFQLEGKLTLTEVDPFDDGLGLQAGARYFLDKQLSAAARHCLGHRVRRHLDQHSLPAEVMSRKIRSRRDA